MSKPQGVPEKDDEYRLIETRDPSASHLPAGVWRREIVQEEYGERRREKRELDQRQSRAPEESSGRPKDQEQGRQEYEVCEDQVPGKYLWNLTKEGEPRSSIDRSCEPRC